MQVRKLHQSYSHPSDDVMLVELDEPLQLDNKTVGLIPLPPPHFNVEGFVQIFGWGRSDFGMREDKLKVTGTEPKLWNSLKLFSDSDASSD